ncbi:MAG: aminotransferase [Treponema sp. RIFOXYC1_FULL_61_9]|nr:MAG: aminotransferase [Treponema sp. GWA1_62_8]OHE62752.1 MAG: aminotransferase [Treponema sp. GWC1_61_84]OHE73160.1 MAG: aminotransferase [Treponema sp. RIFOXYC1_FULL_61_9]
MNQLALELNAALDGTVAARLLSGLGKRLYFPKGIISQSAEAKKLGHRANATIGMAFEGGRPMVLSAIADGMPTLSAAEAVAYAPTAGVESARTAWKDAMVRKNPSLDGARISLPVVVPGLTAGISYIADLFLDEGTSILMSDPSWDNYSLIFADRRGANPVEVPFFAAGPGLDLPAIRKAVAEAAKSGAVRLILNFPQNPSGYSPTRSEAEALIEMIEKTAKGGADVLAICDDAYFGLSYEDDIHPESLFARLSSIHERVLAVKIDGPTKEDFSWGLRTGFVTFGCAAMDDARYDALVKKLMGAIRSSVSCANTPAQFLMVKAQADSRTTGEKEHFRATLKKRYAAVKAFIAANPSHPVLSPLPFNSGYFMSFRCKGIGAETIRQALLKDHGIGTIAFGDKYLRIAFSSVDADHIPELYKTVFEVAAVLNGK